MSELRLDLTDEAVAEALGDCKKGEHKTLTISGTVTAKSATELVLDVEDVEYSDAVEEESEVEKAVAEEEEVAAVPKSTKRPKAVEKLAY